MSIGQPQIFVVWTRRRDFTPADSATYCILRRDAYNGRMTPKQLIDHYGTQSAIAKAAGIKQPSVAEWFAAGVVPEGRQFQFEVLTGGLLRADRPPDSGSPTSAENRSNEGGQTDEHDATAASGPIPAQAAA